MWKPFYFILFVMSPYFLLGQATFDKRIESIKTVPEKSRLDSLASILSDLTLESKETGWVYTRRLLGLSDILNSEQTLLVMRHYAKIAPSGNQALLDSCILYARKMNQESYLSSLYLHKSIFFRKAGIYDSSMIYTLRARDEALLNKDVDISANVLHWLGDLYFSNGNYPRAKEFYLEVQEIKGYTKVWNEWRRRVIRNNLGLIEMNEGNYYTALGLFYESRKEIGNSLKSKDDSLAVAYVLMEIAKGHYFLRDYEKAGKYIDSSLVISEKLDDKQNLFSTFILQAQIATEGKNFAHADELIEKAGSLGNLEVIDISDKLEMLKLKSKISASMNEPVIALEYLNKYVTSADSLTKRLNAARILQLQSKYNYDLLRDDFNKINKEKRVYVFSIIAAVIVILIIVYQFLQLKQKNRRLVALSIDSAKKTDYLLNKSGDDEGNIGLSEMNSFSNSQQRIIIGELQALMIKNKIYLQSNISLQKLSELLGTNRSYLSNAINSVIGQNYTSYINTLRVKEAITLISQGDSAKLNITGLAKEVGFGNRNSFVSAFKKHTGMLPSTFINNYKNYSDKEIHAVDDLDDRIIGT